MTEQVTGDLVEMARYTLRRCVELGAPPEAAATILTASLVQWAMAAGGLARRAYQRDAN